MEPSNEITPVKVTTRSTGVRFGLIFGLVGIAYFVLLNTFGVSTSSGPGSWFTWVFILAAVFIGHKYYKDNGNGYMSFGEGVGIAFWTGLVSSVISSVFTFIYVKFIDAGFITQILDKQREALEAKNMPEDQIEQAMKYTAMFTSPVMLLIFGLIFGIIFYLIVGVVVTIFTQKKNPDITVS